MRELQLKHKKIVITKLASFGFIESDNGYAYKKDILNGQFELELFVTREGKLFTHLTEKAFGDEYTLHLVPDAVGEFVGSVKAAFGEAIYGFTNFCCESEIFMCEQTKLIISYVKEKYASGIEYLWKKFSDNAVFRRNDTKSWYGAILTVSLRKLGFDNDGDAEIVDLRMEPGFLDQRDKNRYLPGYHMNKKSWFTIILDGSVPTEEIYSLIDESYRLAGKKNSKTKSTS